MTESSPLTADEFRTAFPAFTKDGFPDSVLNIYLSLADKFFSPLLWKDEDVRKHVMGLYAAHFLSARGSASSGSASGGSGGGIVASKSVDGASVSYDTSTASEAGAGFWNATPYGKELYQLLRVFGAGAVQL